MARTSTLLYYRRSSTNYSCRTYDSLEGWSLVDGYASGSVAVQASGATKYIWLVSPTSAYASHLRVMRSGVELAPAKVWPEFNPTFTPFGSASGGSSSVFSINLNYDQMHSSGALPYNVGVIFTVFGAEDAGIPITASATVEGVTKSVTVSRSGTYDVWFRAGATSAGTGSPVSVSVRLNSELTEPGEGVSYGFSSVGYRVVPWA